MIHTHTLSDGMKLILDCENKGVPKHLGQIADSMSEWEGSIAEELGLTSANVACIKTKYPNALNLQMYDNNIIVVVITYSKFTTLILTEEKL